MAGGLDNIRKLGDTSALDEADQNVQNKNAELQKAEKDLYEMNKLSEKLLLKNDKLEIEIESLKKEDIDNSLLIGELESDIVKNNTEIDRLNLLLRNFLKQEIKNISEIISCEEISVEDLTPEKKSEILVNAAKEVSNLKKDKESFSKKILEIAKKLFPEEKFSEEDLTDKLYLRIFKKIQSLIENFAEGGEEELRKKNEEIKNLSDLINKIKGQKNYLVGNNNFLEGEVEILDDENSELYTENKLLKIENKDFLDQIEDLSKISFFSKEEIDDLRLKNVSLDDIIKDLEEKLELEVLEKEEISSVVEKISEERNKISEELEKAEERILQLENTNKNLEEEVIETKKSVCLALNSKINLNYLNNLRIKVLIKENSELNKIIQEISSNSNLSEVEKNNQINLVEKLLIEIFDLEGENIDEKNNLEKKSLIIKFLEEKISNNDLNFSDLEKNFSETVEKFLEDLRKKDSEIFKLSYENLEKDSEISKQKEYIEFLLSEIDLNNENFEVQISEKIKEFQNSKEEISKSNKEKIKSLKRFIKKISQRLSQERALNGSNETLFNSAIEKLKKVKNKKIKGLKEELDNEKKKSQEKECENSELKDKMIGFNEEILDISNILKNGMINIYGYKTRLDKLKDNSNTDFALELAEKILKK